MTKEYKELREARLALLCVGDQINYIHLGVGGFKRVVAKHSVFRIFDYGIRLQGYSHLDVPWNAIDLYKDELYILETSEILYPYHSKKRLNEMSEILKAPTTKFMVYDNVYKNDTDRLQD
jgi:hypothetical protein